VNPLPKCGKRLYPARVGVTQTERSTRAEACAESVASSPVREETGHTRTHDKNNTTQHTTTHTHTHELRMSNGATTALIVKVAAVAPKIVVVR